MIVFFPDMAFAWAFVLLVVALLGIAAWTDSRKFVVPKPVAIALLVCGVAMSIARGAWLGAQGHTTWLIANPSALTGALDGLLFALGGFAVGFALFFAFWILGMCGGGDVKVVAALGTWLGPKYILGAFLFSFPIVVVFVVVGLLLGRSQKVAPAAGFTKSRRRIMSYTLPLTVAVAVFLTLCFQGELGLPPILAKS